MRTKKLKKEVALLKYITELKSNITAIKLLRVYEGYYGLKNSEYLDELDAEERKYEYIEKLLKRTPNFKRYLSENMKRHRISSEILNDSGIDKEEMSEEVFYLICHINQYEEKIEQEMTDECDR